MRWARANIGKSDSINQGLPDARTAGVKYRGDAIEILTEKLCRILKRVHSPDTTNNKPHCAADDSTGRAHFITMDIGRQRIQANTCPCADMFDLFVSCAFYHSSSTLSFDFFCMECQLIIFWVFSDNSMQIRASDCNLVSFSFAAIVYPTY
jgi:hypothetical protein